MPADEPVLHSANRSFRYGDGLFETIKVFKNTILLEQFHFQRLLESMLLLKFEVPKLFNTEILKEKILLLCNKNKCDNLGRVRLTVFRGNGGLLEDEDISMQYLIECWPLNKSSNQFNENGLVIGLYTGASKSCDQFSNLKSSNFLPYVMAALFAKEHKLNDCLVLNISGNIADTSIANMFMIKNEIISTPALDEGCISGVMRKYLIGKLKDAGYKVNENAVSPGDLESADEIFLTNAISGIRWVKQFRQTKYSNSQTVKIYKDIFQPMFLINI